MITKCPCCNVEFNVIEGDIVICPNCGEEGYWDEWLDFSDNNEVADILMYIAW